MNSRRNRRSWNVIAACFLTGRFAAACAAGAGSAEGRLLEVEARFVHVTKAQARKAFGSSMAQDGTIAKLTPEQTRKAEQTLVRLKADFFSNPRLLTKAGQHAMAETVREMRYPTELEPSKDEPGKAIPVAFETRDVGVTLAVDAFALPDGQMHLNVIPRVVRFLGFIGYGKGNAGRPAKGPHSLARSLKLGLFNEEICQPVFDSRKVTSEMVIEDGENFVVSELSPSPISKEVGTENVRTFVFINARILPEKDTTGRLQPDSQ